MIARHQMLARRIRLDMEDLEHTKAAVMKHWQGFRTASVDQDAYLNSVALNLQNLYSGLERIFELVAIELDGGPLGGENWHVELLRQMVLDSPGTRPAVLQNSAAIQLDEYRKFRHLVRNTYATSLDPRRIESLVTALPSLWNDVRQDLSAFTDFLEQLAAADEA